MSARCSSASNIDKSVNRQGLVIIDETPGVALENFDQPLLDNHLEVMETLVSRDKNHPSVVVWSLANEPRYSLIYFLLFHI